jgi:N-acetylglucosaminyldiphosphoundecaprenol N-acetyl-beta-D-mannosaminyltransferase
VHPQADAFQRNVHCLLGLPFDAVDMAGAVRRVRASAAERRPCFISTPNLNFVVGSLSDSGFRDSVIHSDLSVADGMPVVWVARLLGIPIRERVAGSSLFERLREYRGMPLKVYFFGGAPGVAEAARRRLNAEARGLECVGFESPGFGSVEALSGEDTIERINASGADFLVVSLGAKKGQAWIERNLGRLRVPAVSHLGAVLNFVAGTVRRAPRWMQRSGLEWLWRLKTEARLAPRYLGDGLAFLRLLATRVLPLAWMIRRHRPGPAKIESANFEIEDDGRRLVARLRGAWAAGNLGKLRAELAWRPLSARDVEIDLSRATYVDTAVLGFLMLVYGAQKHRGRGFVVSPVSARVRKLIEYGCGEFLLAPA